MCGRKHTRVFFWRFRVVCVSFACPLHRSRLVVVDSFSSRVTASNRECFRTPASRVFFVGLRKFPRFTSRSDRFLKLGPPFPPLLPLRVASTRERRFATQAPGSAANATSAEVRFFFLCFAARVRPNPGWYIRLVRCTENIHRVRAPSYCDRNACLCVLRKAQETEAD